MFPSMRIPFSI